MKPKLFLVGVVAVVLSGNPDLQQAAQTASPQSGPSAPAAAAPKFTVDASWPKIPNKWQFGQVASVSVDAEDHVWILQRPFTLEPHEKGQAAPPVLEFDPAGNFVKAWGGPGVRD